LVLSFVPDAEQRLWRTVKRRKYQLMCDRVRPQNQVESLLEEAHMRQSGQMKNHPEAARSVCLPACFSAPEWPSRQ
jgi:hypothetical protein